MDCFRQESREAEQLSALTGASVDDRRPLTSREAREVRRVGGARAGARLEALVAREVVFGAEVLICGDQRGRDGVRERRRRTRTPARNHCAQCTHPFGLGASVRFIALNKWTAVLLDHYSLARSLLSRSICSQLLLEIQAIGFNNLLIFILFTKDYTSIIVVNLGLFMQ